MNPWDRTAPEIMKIWCLTEAVAFHGGKEKSNANDVLTDAAKFHAFISGKPEVELHVLQSGKATKKKKKV